MTKQTLEKFSKLFVKLEHEDKQAGKAGEGGSSQSVRGCGSCLVIHVDRDREHTATESHGLAHDAEIRQGGNKFLTSERWSGRKVGKRRVIPTCMKELAHPYG